MPLTFEAIHLPRARISGWTKVPQYVDQAMRRKPARQTAPVALVTPIFVPDSPSAPVAPL